MSTICDETEVLSGTGELKAQRDVARAAAFFSGIIVLALLIHHFVRTPSALAEVNEAVRLHHGLLLGEQRLLRENEAVLRDTRASLARMRSSSSPSD